VTSRRALVGGVATIVDPKSVSPGAALVFLVRLARFVGLGPRSPYLVCCFPFLLQAKIHLPLDGSQSTTNE
jgi:hypothetical protein